MLGTTGHSSFLLSFIIWLIIVQLTATMCTPLLSYYLNILGEDADELTATTVCTRLLSYYLNIIGDDV